MNEGHKIEALKKLPPGLLCVNVYKCLNKSGNKTSLATIMRALLDPEDFREVQVDALAVAEHALEEFEADVEILLSLIKKGNTTKNLLKKSTRLKILWDHFEEFVSSRERLEVLENQL